MDTSLWSWPLFWPTFAATMGGVGVGGYVTLAVDRSARRRLSAEQKSRAREALAVISAALARNEGGLRDLVRGMDALASADESEGRPAGFNQTPPWVDVDTASWDVVKGDVLLLHRPDFFARVAQHFARVAQLVDLNDALLGAQVAPAAAISRHVHATRGRAWAKLRTQAVELQHDASAVRQDVERMLTPTIAGASPSAQPAGEVEQGSE
jgi:hypothetical protein